MKSTLSSALLATLIIGLSACGQKAETSVAPESAASGAAASAPAANAVQTLESRDNKIRITIPGGHFENIIEQTGERPEGIAQSELTLLERDTNSGITLYAANLGAAKSDAKTYFANLKSTLNSAEGLADVQVGAATDNRMNYRFSQADGAGGTLLENCIAIYDNANLYNVCANSSSAPQTALAAALKEVNLIK